MLSIQLPPLRDQDGDIGLLAAKFGERTAQAFDMSPRSLSRQALERLERHHWPGNVRELANVIEQIYVRTEGHSIEPRHVDEVLALDNKPTVCDASPKALSAALADLEKAKIFDALANASSMAEAARALGMSRSNLYAKLARHGLEVSDGRQASGHCCKIDYGCICRSLFQIGRTGAIVPTWVPWISIRVGTTSIRTGCLGIEKWRELMSPRILIVEDEMIVAMEMEAVIEDLGFEAIGIAADTASALSLSQKLPDVALVDLNLRDGPTGPEIGRKLAERGIQVVFVTANPRMVANGIPGALGVVGKPIDDGTIASVISFAIGQRNGEAAMPPPGFLAFGSGNFATSRIG